MSGGVDVVMDVMSHLRWFRCMVGVVSVALSAIQMPQAQSLLSEPDFSGMHMPGAFGRIIARDSERGWNYVVSGDTDTRVHINGVQSGLLSRINDRGQVDLGWVVAIDVEPRSIIVLSDGNLLVNADIFPKWQRLQRDVAGIYRPQPFQWTTDVVYQGFDPVPVARDPQGNIYSVFFIPATATTPVKRTLRRVSSAGVPDANWRLDIEIESGPVGQLAVNANGSVLYTSARSDTSGPGNIIRSINRASANDALRWSQSFTGTPVALAADAAGRAYLLGLGLGSQGYSGTLLRFEADGAADARWPQTFDVTWSIATVGMRVVGDRLIVIAPRANAGRVSGVRMVSLVDGSILAATSFSTAFATLFADADGTVVTTDLASVALFTPTQTGFSEGRIPFVAGASPTIAAITRWGDGYVVGGQFEYGFDGIRYVNLMRLTATLKPDPTWQPGVNGIVNSVVTDRDGGVMVGGENLLGPHTNLLRFAADGRLDPRWSKRFDGPVTAVTAAASGIVYAGGHFNSIDGASRSSIARFRSDGSLDDAWAPRPPWCPQFLPLVCLTGSAWVTKIIDSGSGGVLALWRKTGGVMLDDGQYLSRFSPTSGGASVPTSSALNAMDPFSISQDPVTGQLYGVHSALDPTTQRGISRFVRLLPTTLEIDPFWTPLIDRPYVVGFHDTHMYLANGRRLVRLANAVADDTHWSLGRVEVAGVAAIATGERLLLWPMRGAPYAGSTARQSIGLQTVVEYFANPVQRYFMTARPAEQQQLDALPAQFMRTGMQFTAFDGAVLSPSGSVFEASQPQPLFNPVGAMPICRFYASPQRGGSNTHFYGRGTDCQFLNTVAGVANEGYDFAALPTKNGLCPVNAPTPVYRLFNNQSANNNGNHRYVVSTARRDEMKARGWLDEGIAFCAVAATDSRSF